MKKLISIVIPVYRNAGSITKTYDQIRNEFEITLQNNFLFEIVFVNDGSDDGSLEELTAIHLIDKRVKVLNLTRNFGQGAATEAGHKAATGQAVITISADLQDPIELMPRMISAFEAGSEVVICYREGRGDPFLARLFSKVTFKLLRLSHKNVPPGGFDYVLMGRKAMDIFNSYGFQTRFFAGDVLWPGFPTTLIPYFRKKRTIGKSQYSFWKKLKSFIDITLDASYLPIRLISTVGMLTALIGILYALTVIASWAFNLSDRPFAGWAPIIVSVLIVGGLNMLMLGIIGEYIWRIYDQQRKRPKYIIKNILE
jgi:dolichol-phosphate mannosyltransferase